MEGISADGALILADDGSRCLVIEGEQGTLIERKNRNYQRLEQIIWKNGCAFGILERAIIPIHGAGPRWEAEERIITAAADVDGLVVATEEVLVILTAVTGSKPGLRINHRRISGLSWRVTQY
jgi:hypothetical protein